MGLLTTVIKKQETPTGINNSNLSANDEKKILLNINSRIEDLKAQNMENAKFLRGISRKIESELNAMREAEDNKSIEVYDDSNIIESINKVQKSLEEISNNDILEAISRIDTLLNDMNVYDVKEGIDKINKSIDEINSNEVLVEIQKVNETVKGINFDQIINELSTINETMSQVNSDVLLIEIDKINKALKNINSDSVLDEVAKANTKLDAINVNEVINEEKLLTSQKEALNNLEQTKIVLENQLRVYLADNSKQAAHSDADDLQILKELPVQIDSAVVENRRISPFATVPMSKIKGVPKN